MQFIIRANNGCVPLYLSERGYTPNVDEAHRFEDLEDALEIVSRDQVNRMHDRYHPVPKE